MSIITAALVAGALLILVSLSRSREWSLAESISEKRSTVVTSTGEAGQDRPEHEASASRLIAIFGLLVLAAVILGVGYALIWNLFVNGKLPPLEGIGTYLTGGASLFAPYAINQLRTSLTPPQKP